MEWIFQSIYSGSVDFGLAHLKQENNSTVERQLCKLAQLTKEALERLSLSSFPFPGNQTSTAEVNAFHYFIDMYSIISQNSNLGLQVTNICCVKH